MPVNYLKNKLPIVPLSPPVAIAVGIGVLAAGAVAVTLWGRRGQNMDVRGPGGFRAKTTGPDRIIETDNIEAKQGVKAEATAIPEARAEIRTGDIRSHEGGVDLRTGDSGAPRP